MALAVAISAAAARTALGKDLAATWARMDAGESALAPLGGPEAEGFGAVQVARIWREAESPEDDPALRILGPHGRLLSGLAAACHAAGALASLPREHVGLFVALGMVDSPSEELAPAVLAARDEHGALSLQRFFAGAYRLIHPLWPLAMLGNVAAGQIAIDLDVRGDNLVLASAGDAGLRALLEGARSVDEGACQAALAGGATGRIGPALLARLALQGGLPGANPGEGGAVVALESEASAGARGQRVLAFLRGGGTAFGRRAVGPGPDEGAWVRAIQAALGQAQVAGEEVACVLGAAPTDPASACQAGALATAGLGQAQRLSSAAVLGELAVAGAAVDVALLVASYSKGRWPGAPPGSLGPARHALVLAGGPEGGAGALVVQGGPG